MSFSFFCGSKCTKSRYDNYDDSEETQMDTNGATQEHSSVSEKNFLEKRQIKKMSLWYIPRLMLLQILVEMYPQLSTKR